MRTKRQRWSNAPVAERRRYRTNSVCNMSNYERVSGVSYSRYVDDEQDPVTNQHDAKVEEMYFHDGKVVIRATTDDGHIGIGIPILPREDWDGFVDSLPQWDLE